MALFVLLNNDKPDALALRMATREAHLAYVGGFGERIKLGGPVLDDKGDMAGSLILFEAETIDEARTFSANDPYMKAGLFAQTQVLAFRMSLQNLV